MLADLTDLELSARLTEQQDKIANLRDKCLKQSEHRGRLRAMLEEDQEEVQIAAAGIDWESVFRHTKQLRSRLLDQAQGLRPRVANQVAPTIVPRYLEHASQYLDQFTGGQFRGLNLVDEDRDLMVLDGEGRAIPLAEVHPNHFANIFFSLWLARIEAYADRGVRLPVVLEDPLESTRDTRRDVVAQLLTQFAARGHQLILVTAHAENARQFATLGVPIADFSKREPVPQHVDAEELQSGV